MCEQELHTDKHTHLVDDIKKQQAEKIEEQSFQLHSQLNLIEKQISEQGEVGDKPETAYSPIDEAYDL